MRLQSLALTVAALALVVVFASLGRWQWSRAEFKEARTRAHAAALAAPPRSLAAVLREDAVALPVRVTVGAGQHAQLPPLLLDNQVREGRNGVMVYRVLVAAPGLPAVLVEQGWSAWPPGRTLPALPPPRPPDAGLLVPWPGQALALGDPPPRPADDAAPWVLARIERAHLARALGIPLFDGVLRPVGAETGRNAGGMTPERHRGYAVQWFALAGTVLAVWLALAWRASRR